MDRDHAPVLALPFPPHQAVFFQIVDHHRYIPAAAQKLVTQRSLTHRPQMKQRLQYSELARRYVVPLQVRTQSHRHRVRCPRQINERIQRPGRPAIAFKMCRHYSLTINRLTSNHL